MNRNLNSKFRNNTLIGKLRGIAFIVVVCISVSGFQCGVTDSANTTNPTERGWHVMERLPLLLQVVLISVKSKYAISSHF